MYRICQIVRLVWWAKLGRCNAIWNVDIVEINGAIRDDDP